MSVHWPILRRLLMRPTRIVAVDDRRSYRAAEILVGAFHIADLIEKRCESQTVGALLPTSGAFSIVALGAWIAGRTVVPLNYLLKRDELQYIIDDCETDTVLASTELLDFLGDRPSVKSLIELDKSHFQGVPSARWPAAAAPDDLAALLYTSGTSGRPKGVMLTHANISANIRQCVRAVRFDSSDVVLGVLPQFHSFGFTVLTLLPLTIGAKSVFTARFVPTRIIKLFEEHKPTAFVGIPSMYGALLHLRSATPEPFASLKYTVSGGEPLPDAVADGFRERFDVTINEGYGLTETSPVTNLCRPWDFVPHCVGPPLPDIEQRIVDIESGRILGAGEEGEIRMRGPNIMRGYFKLPDETAAVFDEDGYFRTGDIGKQDERGRLYITGRLKEMIIVGGENVFPREIEEVLNRHASVHASAVIGVHDDVRGELPWAFVELNEGAAFDESALRSFCREHLAGYKVPREIRVIEKLPRNPTGKILRRELRDLITETA